MALKTFRPLTPSQRFKALPSFEEITKSNPEITHLTDDFGQCFYAHRSAVHGVMLEDLTESQLGMIERSLHNKRGEVKANQRAAADPAIKTAMMSRTPVYSPVS